VIVKVDGSIPWLANVPPDEVRRIVDALYRVHRLISAITDRDTLLERIMEEGKDVARAEACSLLLYDAPREELYFQVAQGESGDQQALKREVRLKLGQGIAGEAAASRESINVDNVDEDPRFFRFADQVSRFKTHSLLAVPLLDHEDLVGVIEVVNKAGGGTFTDTDLHVLEMFSSLAATAIANAHLIEENLRAARMAAIGQAMAGLSHYAKNIITTMTNSVDLIDEGLQAGDHGMVGRMWPIFKRSANRISDFVQDMLAYSKPRQPVIEACSVSGLVDDVVQSVAGLQGEGGPSLEVDTAGVCELARLDARGLFRCLLNLVGNAVEAAPSEAGRVVVRAAATPDDGLVIEVADNGPGIAEENRAKVFEPFFSTKGSRGTGLGLAVTQKIIREHGGEIDVSSAPEGGALFRITLPGACEAKS